MSYLKITNDHINRWRAKGIGFIVLNGIDDDANDRLILIDGGLFSASVRDDLPYWHSAKIAAQWVKKAISSYHVADDYCPMPDPEFSLDEMALGEDIIIRMG